MTPDQERWAEALMVSRIHGPRAPLHVVDRIVALTLTGDTAGVARWEEIAARLVQLTPPEVIQ